MIRLMLRLLRITDYEVCQSCQTLKNQLEFERAEKKELLDTLLTIVKPKAYEAPAQELTPIVNSSALFSRRRAALEAQDREAAKILRNSTNLGKPDDALHAIDIQKAKDVTRLEHELGVEEREG